MERPQAGGEAEGKDEEHRADDGHRRGKLVAPAAIAAAVGGAVFFWRRLQGGDDDEGNLTKGRKERTIPSRHPLALPGRVP